MTKLGLSVASDSFVIFRGFEEELMLLGGALVTECGLES
jgi:hypothetical protein